jgi:hypothetical protein
MVKADEFLEMVITALKGMGGVGSDCYDALDVDLERPSYTEIPGSFITASCKEVLTIAVVISLKQFHIYINHKTKSGPVFRVEHQLMLDMKELEENPALYAEKLANITDMLFNKAFNCKLEFDYRV